MEEDIAIVLLMHKNKRSKYGGSVWGHGYIRRQRTGEDNKLMLNYVFDHSVYPERYFHHRFRMPIDLFKHIA
jgi:hypothetical protein